MNLNTQTLFDSVLIMLVPVLAGFAAAKLGYFKDNFAGKLSAFVLNIAQPFMILASILGTEYSAENLHSGLTVLLVALIAHATAAAMALPAALPLKDQKERRVSEFCMIFSNCGFFGFPLLKAVYGDIGVFWGGFYIIVFNFLMWTYGVFILSRANREMKIRLTKIFLNGGTIPCVIGFLLYILRIEFYPAIYESIDTLGSTCTPLSMVIVGAMIANIPFKQLFTKLTVYYTSFIRLVFLPVVTVLVLKLLGFSEEMTIFGALMMALPSAAGSAMFANTYDIKPELAAQTVGISTLLSVASVPLIMQVCSLLV